MYCKFCGTQIDKQSVFCWNCGKKLVGTNVTAEESIKENKKSDDNSKEENTDIKKPIDDIKKEGNDVEQLSDNFENQNNDIKGDNNDTTKIGKYLLIGAVALLILIVTWLPSSGSNKEPEVSKVNSTVQNTETANTNEMEHVFSWPDIVSYLGSENYVDVSVTNKLTLDTEVNNGETGLIQELRVEKSRKDMLDGFINLVQRMYGFELVERRELEEKVIYFFRHINSNAPATVKSLETNYHCTLQIEESDNQYIVTQTWLDGFSHVVVPEPLRAQGNVEAEDELEVNTEPIQTETLNEETTALSPTEDTHSQENITTTQTENTQFQQPQSQVIQRTNDIELQDPCVFFDCAKHEEGISKGPFHDREVRMVSCKFDMDTGDKIVGELLALINEKYPYELTKTEVDDYTKTSAMKFYDYYFNYTGGNEQIDGYFVEIDDEMYPCDLEVSFNYNYQGGWILVTVYMDTDVQLVDHGYRSSALPIDYSGASDETTENDDGTSGNKSVLPCISCGGDGDCSKCNGRGYLWSSASDSEDRNCWKCNASGVCQTCHGSGKR